MNHSKDKIWIAGFLLIVVVVLGFIAFQVIRIDPFFHYRKPKTDTYYYTINNERSQNDGIVKHFDYDALIAGTSMTQNFKTSEADELFGVSAIKVPAAGGSFREINETIAVALRYQPKLKTIIRGLDMNMFTQDKDTMRTDLGAYPTYLYDENPFNDVKYLFNKNVLLDHLIPMLTTKNETGSGITSFDEYANWMAYFPFGVHAVCAGGVPATEPAAAVHLSEEEKQTVLENIEQNVISLPAAYPDVTFYYFFPPYSAIYWQSLVNNGEIYKQIEAEQIVIEEILQYDNIKLFSFNEMTDITTDLNNYEDTIHYGEWINSLILAYMKDGKCLLTAENYSDYLDAEQSFYTAYDYDQLNDQTDYADDYEAELVISEKYLP
jgi:hypothetical protein